MAVGDDENDLEMIRHAGLGVAMGNAAEAVKAAADFITGSNADDGLVQALQQFVLAR
jgi:hydroxymethylpyrimidine pyrophosphatase-like HAD family hydrolase